MPDTGYMLTPLMGNRPDLSDMLWAADNGCFAQPGKYSHELYLGWLAEQAVYRKTCLFATAPDAWGDAAATWRKSKPILPVLRAMGYAAALVAQDGQQEPDWDAFDALFVGGTNTFKFAETTYALVAEAKRRGKWVHAGRVNSRKRLVTSALAGYDSADGTYLAFGPDVNLPKLQGWMRQLQQQPHLWSAHA